MAVRKNSPVLDFEIPLMPSWFCAVTDRASEHDICIGLSIQLMFHSRSDTQVIWRSVLMELAFLLIVDLCSASFRYCRPFRVLEL